jgi:hypothetical protein
VIRGPGTPDIGAEEHHAGGPGRIGRGKQRGEQTTLRMTQEERALGPGRIHHCPDIVHPGLKIRESIVWHSVGESGTSFVERDQARERRQPVEPRPHPAVFPHQLNVRDPAGDEHQVDRAVTADAVRDMDVAALRVPSLRYVHGSVLRQTRRLAMPPECCPPRTQTIERNRTSTIPVR